MLRRSLSSTVFRSSCSTRVSTATTAQLVVPRRAMSRTGGGGDDALSLQDAPMPPSVPTESVTPLDFNPHIEWVEFPKEIFSPLYPFTREECIRMADEKWDYSTEELADRYGIRVHAPFKANFWMAWIMSAWYLIYEIWGGYRATGNHPTWPQWRLGVMADSRCPKISEDEIYLDQWMFPAARQMNSRVHDKFWAWKPPVATNIVNPHAIEFRHRDPSEFKHMCDVATWQPGQPL